MDQSLRKTALHSAHGRLKARMVPFAGWEMPIQYAGITSEHQAVRNDVGVFDVSHMGQVQIKGAASLPFLQALLPQDISRLMPGKLLYTVLCNAAGGIIDDLQVWCLDKEEYLLVINASRTSVDLKIIRDMASNFTELEILELTTQHSMLALQGPDSRTLLEALVDGDMPYLGWYNCTRNNLAGTEVLLSRSGYTGELGFEIICQATVAELVWDLIISRGGVPCGLGARDTLRTEAGLCLYGNELNEQINPLEVGLGWTLKLQKDQDFLGKEALTDLYLKGPKRQLLGLVLEEKGIPRLGYEVLNNSGDALGAVTSGGFSPTLKKGIAIILIKKNSASPGQIVGVNMRGKIKKACIVQLPFIASRTRKKTGQQRGET